MTTKEGYEAHVENMHRTGNDEDKLNELFIRMKDLSKENMQAVPTGWYLSEDENTAYAEFENINPLVLATRNNGVFVADY